MTVGGERVLVSVIRDITERSLAEQSLRESERRTLAVLNAVTESIWLLDRDGRVLLASATAAERAGSAPGGDCRPPAARPAAGASGGIAPPPLRRGRPHGRARAVRGRAGGHGVSPHPVPGAGRGRPRIGRRRLQPRSHGAASGGSGGRAAQRAAAHARHRARAAAGTDAGGRRDRGGPAMPGHSRQCRAAAAARCPAGSQRLRDCAGAPAVAHLPGRARALRG